VLVAVPFEPGSAHALDPGIRSTLGAHLDLPLREAFARLEAHLGQRLDRPPTFAGGPLTRGAHRSLTAVVLASALERQGLSFRVLDPGARGLSAWRALFAAERGSEPGLVAISTTFITSRPWLVELLALARAAFPQATLALGGYYYTTDAEGFLSLDADVFCVGEGETRLPEIALTLAQGRPLRKVPGLYLRRDDGSLEHTGRAEPLDLARIPAPDWQLSARIEPALAPGEIPYFGLETQRGCAFMCAFCTYRTLASPTAMPPELAAERVLELGRAGARYVELYDATASSPKRRFKELLAHLVAANNAVPIGAFARLSDVDREAAELMQAAGVRHLFVGQESGDQRLLNAMRKGTRASDVLPAVELCGRHGITLTFGMIHGFPGEDAESLAASRRLLATVNASAPVVFSYDVVPFALQDFAAVSQDPMLERDRHHFLSYRYQGFGVREACREILRTIISTSRIPHAPVAHAVFQRTLSLPTHVISVSPERERIFRWAKALERGVALELERLLDGRRPDALELDRVAREILEPFARGSLRRERWRALVEVRSLRLLCAEWKREGTRGPGPLTRLGLLVLGQRRAARSSGSGGDAREHARRLLSTVDRRYEPKRSESPIGK
jgi:radical SAM superfamily enzyme YgiQ (UPF0313 family)